MANAKTVWKTKDLKKALTDRIKALKAQYEKDLKAWRVRAIGECEKRITQNKDLLARLKADKPLGAGEYVGGCRPRAEHESLENELVVVEGHTQDTISVDSSYVRTYLTNSR